MALWIGIDLGTTNSVVALHESREPRVIPNEEGQRLTPSVVTFLPDGGLAVGAVARRQAVTVPERTVHSVKRILGRRYDDVRGLADSFSWRLTELPNGDAGVLVDGRAMAPAEVSAHVLRKLKKAVEEAYNEKVAGAVITVPAYFNDAQRQATRQAGQLAGLEVRRILNEPTAAALAHGLQAKGHRKVAVYDFGGGTFDLSLLEFDNDVIEVRATAGDTALGGDDIDALIVDRFFRELQEKSGVDFRQDRVAAQRLRDAAERAKIALSTADQTEAQVPFLQTPSGETFHFASTLYRRDLETMMASLFGRTLACCERALEDAGWTASDVDEVLLVGGSTRIPLVRDRVERFFGRPATASVHPDEVVALGAAVQAAILGGDEDLDVLLLDVTPLSLGVETRGGLATRLVERNTTIPTRARRRFSTAVDSQRTVAIHVVQGERTLASENRSLGRFELGGLPALPKGEARIEVTFDIDANGIVSVSAVESTTGKEASIRITDAGGMDADEIARRIEDAERHAAADAEAREKLERSDRLHGWIARLQREPNLVDALVAEERELWKTTTDALLEAVAEGKVPGAVEAQELEARAIDVAKHLEDRRIALGAAARRESGGGAQPTAPVAPVAED